MKSPIALPKTPAWLAEFQAFIMRGNVVDLAVGVIIGAAFTGIVASLVKDIFTPVLGLVLGGIDFANIFITLKGGHFDTLDQARAAGAATLNVGLFLNAVIQFVIVAFVIFWVVKAMTRLVARPVVPPEPPPPPRSEVLLGEIRDLLARRSPLP